MKKKIIRTAMALICVLSLASCGQDIAEEASEKGKNYFDSGDYETAAKAFGVALENNCTDEEVQLLYDITLKYHQASTAFEKGDSGTAKKILDSMNKSYENYGIKESVEKLKKNVNNSLDTEDLLNDIAEEIENGDYEKASALADNIDISALSGEQVKKLNQYKATIVSSKLQSEENISEPTSEEQSATSSPVLSEHETESASQQPNQQTTNAQTAKEKTADEKVAQEKAAQQKAAQEKAAQEKAAQEKAAQQKAAQEKAAQQKAAQEKAAQEKAAQEKAAQQIQVKPAINTNVSNDTYIYPTDTTLLTAEQLKTLSKNDISLIRNEIYARKGHIFTTSKYQNYFAQKTWYTPSTSVAWDDFNEIEKANIRLIKEFEASNQ